MEVSRKRNQATKVVFPLLNATSATQYYTTSAWTSMTNATKTVYFWSDDDVAPTSATIAANPVQLDGFGLWYLIISASEISAASQYMSIKMKSDQILEQTILIRITNYDASVDTVSSPLTISAYQNFPQVTVSSGIISTVTNPVVVSAYQNFPRVIVSGANANVSFRVSAAANNISFRTSAAAGGVFFGTSAAAGGVFFGTSAYTNFPQVTVSANLDKTNYTVSSGTLNTVNDVTNPVIVSAYQNFPQVYASAGNLDNFTGNIAGSVGSITNSVSVSAQTNHPSVQVSGIDGGLYVGTSAYQNFPQVYVSANGDKSGYSITANSDKTNYTVSSGTIDNVSNPVIVSAFQNFPQVTVSANLDKTNYTVSSGSITAVNGNVTGSVASVTNPVTVSAYQNMPQVQVSGINGGLYVGTSAYTNFPQVYVSAGTVNSVTNPVVVSAYQNFPSVNVSSVTDGTIVSADFGADYWTRVQLGLATSTSVSNVQTTVNQVSSDTAAILTDTNEIQSKLPAGQIASQQDIASIIQNTRFVASIPTDVIVPTSGDVYYKLAVYFYNMSGTMENPDGEIAIMANSVRQISALTSFYNDSSGAVPATISPTFSGNYYAMVSAGTGIWYTYYRFNASAFTIPDEIVFDFALKENTQELHYGRVTTIYQSDPTSVQLASTDVNKDVIARAIREFDASSISIGTNSVEKTIENVSREQVTVSAYTNFPQVTVSANLDKTNYTVSSGTVNNVTNPVTVSAYQNFPQVYVSGGSVTATVSGPVQVSGINGGVYVGTSAYTNFPQVTVSANLDKINYTVSSGTVNTVTNPVIVSAYQNFPKVEVSAITDGIIASADFQSDYWNRVQLGLATTSQLASSALQIVTEINQNETKIDSVQSTVNQISANTNSISGLATSTQVSNVQNTANAISAVTNQFTFNGSAVNAYSTNELVMPAAVVVSAYQNFPAVQVSGINVGVYGSVSAYQNMPQVTVSANLDKTNYTVSSGTVDTVINPITVSAYQNFPAVQVSGFTSGISVSAEITIDYEAIKNANVSAIDEKFTFSGTAVEAYSVNELVMPAAVTVSAYQNFPEVQVSGINTGVYGSVSAFVNMPQVTVSANLDKTNYTVSSGIVDTVNNSVTVSAYQNFPEVTVVSAAYGAFHDYTFASDFFNAVQQGMASASQVNDVQNTVNAISAVTDQFSFTSGSVNAYSTNELTVSAIVTTPVIVSAYQNFPEVMVSAFTSAAMTDIVNGVWDEELTLAKHNVNNSSGKRLRDLSVSVGGTTIYSGVVVSATSNSVTLDSSAASYSGAYDPSLIAIVGGMGAGQSRLVLEYNGPGHTALVDRDWKIIPDSSSEFIIYAHPGREHVNEGRATGGTSASISLNPWASDYDDVYVGQLIFLRSGYGQDQVGLVTAYDGSTHIAYISDSWDEIPDNTTGYVILPNHIHTAEYDALAVWNSSLATSAISGGTLVAIQDQFTFNSPGIVNSFVSGGIVSADPATIVAALLSTTVDGKTFEELMEILLAMASGRITRVNNKFTYYKQDNTTALFTLESERSERTRL